MTSLITGDFVKRLRLVRKSSVDRTNTVLCELIAAVDSYCDMFDLTAAVDKIVADQKADKMSEPKPLKNGVKVRKVHIYWLRYILKSWIRFGIFEVVTGAEVFLMYIILIVIYVSRWLW